MVYRIPQTYACPKCGFETDYSPSLHYTFLPVADHGDPFCYKCLIEWIAQNVPVMKRKEEHGRNATEPPLAP